MLPEIDALNTKKSTTTRAMAKPINFKILNLFLNIKLSPCSYYISMRLDLSRILVFKKTNFGYFIGRSLKLDALANIVACHQINLVSISQDRNVIP